MDVKEALKGFASGTLAGFAGYIVGAIGAQVLPLNVPFAVVGAGLGFLSGFIKEWL